MWCIFWLFAGAAAGFIAKDYYEKENENGDH